MLEHFGGIGAQNPRIFYTPPPKNNNIKSQNDCLDGFPLQTGGFQDHVYFWHIHIGPWILQPAGQPFRANTPDAKQLSFVWPNEVLTGLFVEDEDLVKMAVVINFSTTGCLNDTC